MRRVAIALVAVALLSGFAGRAAAAGLHADRIEGHLSFGYGRLMIGHSPAGSIGVTAGFEYPVRPGLSVGPDLGVYLYGNRGVERGSLNATIDYSALDLLAFTHWALPRGPVTRASVGLGMTHARGELSSSAGGASFLDLAVNDNAPTVALDLTTMKRKPSPVRVAAILGWRSAFVKGEDWHQASIRVGFQY